MATGPQGDAFDLIEAFAGFGGELRADAGLLGAFADARHGGLGFGLDGGDGGGDLGVLEGSLEVPFVELFLGPYFLNDAHDGIKNDQHYRRKGAPEVTNQQHAQANHVQHHIYRVEDVGHENVFVRAAGGQLDVVALTGLPPLQDLVVGETN